MSAAVREIEAQLAYNILTTVDGHHSAPVIHFADIQNDETNRLEHQRGLQGALLIEITGIVRQLITVPPSIACITHVYYQQT